MIVLEIFFRSSSDSSRNENSKRTTILRSILIKSVTIVLSLLWNRYSRDASLVDLKKLYKNYLRLFCSIMILVAMHAHSYTHTQTKIYTCDMQVSCKRDMYDAAVDRWLIWKKEAKHRVIRRKTDLFFSPSLATIGMVIVGAGWGSCVTPFGSTAAVVAVGGSWGRRNAS